MLTGTAVRAARTFTMAKRRGGARGPYKATKSDVSDPDQLGTLGIRLRQHRLARHLTVEMLAELAGVSVGTVSGIEAGKLGFTQQTLGRLAKALETSVGALFDVDPRGGPGNEIWPIWKRAKGKARARIVDFAQGAVGEDE